MCREIRPERRGAPGRPVKSMDRAKSGAWLEDPVTMKAEVDPHFSASRSMQTPMIALFPVQAAVLLTAHNALLGNLSQLLLLPLISFAVLAAAMLLFARRRHRRECPRCGAHLSASVIFSSGLLSLLRVVRVPSRRKGSHANAKILPLQNYNNRLILGREGRHCGAISAIRTPLSGGMVKEIG